MSHTKPLTLRASSAQVAGSETGTEANSGAHKHQKIYTAAVFFLDVTALANDVNDTLDVYIDVSLDGGTSWINAIHFPQILGNGSAAKHVAKLNHSIATPLHVVTADLAANAARQIGLGTMIRYRGDVVDPTGSNATFTYTLKAFLH